MKRRHFLNTAGSAAVGSVLAATPSIQAAGANRKVVVAAMGMGGRGMTLASGLEELDGVEVRSVYDVDATRAEYAAHVVGKVNQRNDIAHGQDFRTALEDPDIDALVVATSNHWHAPAAVLGALAGKHIYVEKPCSHNPREGELMIAASRKHNVRIQHGTQRRSRPGELAGLARIKEGAIGRVYSANCYYRGNRPSIGVGTSVPVPEYLDYDLWQGPAPRVPFRDNRLHYNWHWFWHWGNGELGNHGVHRLDIAREALGVDFPVRVTCSGGRYRYPGDDQETPDTQIATFEFEDKRYISWEGLSCSRSMPGTPSDDIWVHGEGGTAVLTAVGYRLLDERGVEFEKQSGNGGQREHLENFVAAIREEADLNADIVEGHRSSLICHLGNIAYRTSGALRCDPDEGGKILDDPEAMKLWSRVYEDGWEPVV